MNTEDKRKGIKGMRKMGVDRNAGRKQKPERELSIVIPQKQMPRFEDFDY